MTPRCFWKLTPRKLSLLVKVHIDLNTVKDKDKDNKTKKGHKLGYIDQVF